MCTLNIFEQYDVFYTSFGCAFIDSACINTQLVSSQGIVLKHNRDNKVQIPLEVGNGGESRDAAGS